MLIQLRVLFPVSSGSCPDDSFMTTRYRALYAYRPQNEDELELREGDEVFVMEMCDDGWYVGTSARTGCFGTFPGNYVNRICECALPFCTSSTVQAGAFSIKSK